MHRNTGRVREPVQAYLDKPDAELLDEIAERTSLSKAEVIRRGIRRLAQDLRLSSRPFAGLDALTGALEAARNAPTDLAARHDAYLYGARAAAPTRRR